MIIINRNKTFVAHIILSRNVSDLFLAMWELPQTVACRIGQTLCHLEPKHLNKTSNLLSLSRKEDYHTSRKCLSDMLYSFLAKMYLTFGLSMKIFMGWSV